VPDVVKEWYGYRGKSLDPISLTQLTTEKETLLAKPNYQYEKRQKDLAKKKKQEEKLEEKRQRKLDKSNVPPAETPQ
jgi:hypothetical protein